MDGQVTIGDCVAGMRGLPEKSVDLVFADPPYFLQLSGETLTRPDASEVHGVVEEWDVFSDFAAYDAFTRDWLSAARRTMRPGATIFVLGSYHNIFRIGSIMQDLGFWILNDIVWVKDNPMPNFRGRRLTNATETMIWAVRDRRDTNYTFNYATLKEGNDDVQLRSDWVFPVCGGKERLRKADKSKVHPTQKPLALVERALHAASRPGDLVLDPFLGTGTTGVAAKRLNRRFVGFERDPAHGATAIERIRGTEPLDPNLLITPDARLLARRVPFRDLVDAGVAPVSGTLTCKDQRKAAVIRPDGLIDFDGSVGSIHKMGAKARQTESCNGWTFWHLMTGAGIVQLDHLRQGFMA